MTDEIARHAGVFEAFHRVVYPAFWVEKRDMGDREVVAAVLAGAGLDAAALLEKSAAPEVKGGLRATTDEAVARGVFGAPTIFVEGEMYFGSDRLPFVERALEAQPR